jgi:hypothetical protein
MQMHTDFLGRTRRLLGSNLEHNPETVAAVKAVRAVEEGLNLPIAQTS